MEKGDEKHGLHAKFNKQNLFYVHIIKIVYITTAPTPIPNNTNFKIIHEPEYITAIYDPTEYCSVSV